MINDDMVRTVGIYTIHFPAALFGLFVLAGPDTNMLNNDFMSLNTHTTFDERNAGIRGSLTHDGYVWISKHNYTTVQVNDSTNFEDNYSGFMRFHSIFK